MPYVDQDVVAGRLSGSVPGLQFRAVPPDDASVDGEVKILRDGVELDMSVQVGSGYVCLNRYGYSCPGDLSSFYSQQLGSWGVQPEDLAELAKAVNLEALRLVKLPA